MATTVEAQTGALASTRVSAGALSMGRGFLKSLLPLVVVGIIWEITASRIVNPLFPPISIVLSSMWRLILNGTLEAHVISTMWRLLFGFGAAVAFGIPLGLLMARSKKVETAALPIVSVLMPIPAIAWVPLFILWFGLGERPTIYLVAFETFLPMVFNSWTGTKTINEVWIRAAQSMGARGGTLFIRVVVPAALPFIITGMRIGLARAWRAVVAGEMLSATTFGLGWMIFEARDFIRTDVMMSGILVIGITGLILEKLLFQLVENYTVVRWGMLRDSA